MSRIFKHHSTNSKILIQTNNLYLNNNVHVTAELLAWQTLKPQLQAQLLSGEYCFQPVTLVETTHRLGELETQEIWQTQDQLVLKAMSLVLKDHLTSLQGMLSVNFTRISGLPTVESSRRCSKNVLK